MQYQCIEKTKHLRWKTPKSSLDEVSASGCKPGTVYPSFKSCGHFRGQDLDQQARVNWHVRMSCHNQHVRKCTVTHASLLHVATSSSTRQIQCTLLGQGPGLVEDWEMWLGVEGCCCEVRDLAEGWGMWLLGMRVVVYECQVWLMSDRPGWGQGWGVTCFTHKYACAYINWIHF